MRDWIDDFLDYTDGRRSPEIFRLWTAISIIAGAAERRVWTISGMEGACYPNLFVMLVAPPAVGKGIIREATDIWRYTKGFKIAPSDVSASSLIDALAQARIDYKNSDGVMQECHYLQCGVEEFGVFFKSYDMIFLTILSDIWNNPPNFQQTRRTDKLNLDIIKPGINILMGAQPGVLASMLPPEAWSQDFMTRVIMIYSAKTPKIRSFEFPNPDFMETQAIKRTELINELAKIRNISGLCEWEPAAIQAYQLWEDSGLQPVPTHSKLEHYLGRRGQNLQKLCMISGLSRHRRPFVEFRDFDRALNWLLDAETRMPDVFRAMTGRSDSDVMEEAYIYAWQTQAAKRPLTKARLATFLAQRVPQEKVEPIIGLMQTMAFIEEIGPGEFRALTKDNLGVE